LLQNCSISSRRKQAFAWWENNLRFAIFMFEQLFSFKAQTNTGPAL